MKKYSACLFEEKLNMELPTAFKWYIRIKAFATNSLYRELKVIRIRQEICGVVIRQAVRRNGKLSECVRKQVSKLILDDAIKTSMIFLKMQSKEKPTPRHG